MRESNTELLRIIAMFFVMLLHFNNHGFCVGIVNFEGDLILHNTISHLIESLAIVAVNVFVIISGLHGIHFKGRGLFRLYLQCFAMGMVGYLLYLLIAKQPISMAFFGRFFAFTHNHWWFIIAYVCLYCVSPLLNAGVKALQKRELQVLILCITIILTYLGYAKGYDFRNGSSFLNFMYLYIIGRYIGMYVTKEIICQKRWLWLMLYIGCSMCIFIEAILKQKYHFEIAFIRPYLYNNFFVIGGAIFLVLFIKSFTFYSSMINWMGSSVLAAYLIQESPYFGHKVLYPYMEKCFWNIANGLGGGVCLFVRVVGGVPVIIGSNGQGDSLGDETMLGII